MSRVGGKPESDVLLRSGGGPEKWAAVGHVRDPRECEVQFGGNEGCRGVTRKCQSPVWGEGYDDFVPRLRRGHTSPKQ